MSVDLHKNSERHRYEILIDDALAGYVDYEARGDLIALPHTYVNPGRRGGGVAANVVGFALEDIRAQRCGVLPVCPYVAAFIARNRDAYLDLVPEPERATYGLD